MQDKDTLRKRYKDLRSCIKDPRRSSMIIINNLVHQQEYRSAKVILAYYPLKGEVDISKIMDDPVSRGKQIYIPMHDELLIGNIKDGAERLKNGYTQPKNPIDPDDIDIEIILIPGLAFSKQGVRLGHGMGWYDRFLSKYAKKAIKIGICFDKFLVDKIPYEGHDVKVDMIITEKDVLYV